MANTTGVRTHTTQSHQAYEPANNNVSRPWQLLIVGLLLVAIVAMSVRSVCLPEVPGANERGLGVRHERRGAIWDHCEPWIRRVLRPPSAVGAPVTREAPSITTTASRDGAQPDEATASPRTAPVDARRAHGRPR